MRLALLVLAEQGAKKNEQREYAEAQTFYHQAKALYEKRGNASGDDPEMGRLTSLMEELQANGWLDGNANTILS